MSNKRRFSLFSSNCIIDYLSAVARLFYDSMAGKYSNACFCIIARD